MYRPWAVYNQAGVLLKRKKTRQFAERLAQEHGGYVQYEPNYQEEEN